MSFPCQVGLVVVQVVEKEYPDDRSQLSDHLAVEAAAYSTVWNYAHPTS
jgi:hypothetical protein